jgi:hypothetical protein
MTGFSTTPDTAADHATRFTGYHSPHELVIFDEAGRIPGGLEEEEAGSHAPRVEDPFAVLAEGGEGPFESPPGRRARPPVARRMTAGNPTSRPRSRASSGSSLPARAACGPRPDPGAAARQIKAGFPAGQSRSRKGFTMRTEP